MANRRDTVSRSGQIRKIGLAVGKFRHAEREIYDLVSASTYIEWPVTPKTFYTWATGGLYRTLHTLIVTDARYIPYLEFVKHKVSCRVVCLGIDSNIVWIDADKNLDLAQDIGWYAKDKYNLHKMVLHHHRPVGNGRCVYTDSHDIASQLATYGIRTSIGENLLGCNVAVLSKTYRVPEPIYRAVASGVPVVTTRSNKKWMTWSIGFTSFIEDGIDRVVEEIMSVDVATLGLMLSDMVLDRKSFRKKLRNMVLT